MRRLLVLVALIGILPACGAAQLNADTTPPAGTDEEWPQHPPAQGPVEEVARGEIEGRAWRLTAYRSKEGLCVDLHLRSNSGGGCGFGGRPKHLSVSGVSWSNELPKLAQLEGEVPDDVAKLTARSGGQSEADVPDATDLPPGPRLLDERKNIR